jgi:cell division protein FtsA
MLLGIIAPRMEEILSLAREELVRARMLDQAAAGVILTGGGASMPGLSELAEEIFALPVRIGAPRDLPATDSIQIGPKYSTAIGLVRYALTREDREPIATARGRHWQNAASGRVKEWLQGIF